VVVVDPEEAELAGEEVAVDEGVSDAEDESDALVPVDETAVCDWLQPAFRPSSPAAEMSSRSRRRTTRFYHASLRHQGPT
jgi:hypothetical protein